MTNAGHRAHAQAYLRKASEYLASAEDNLIMERATPAAGDAVHAGINAKDAMVTVLTGTTGKARDHVTGAAELRRALGRRVGGAGAERALRELLSAKTEIEYSTTLVTPVRAQSLVRRARSLVELATDVARLGR